MGFELREIDDGNTGEYICSPQLEIAGDAISLIELDEIVSVGDGYTRKDSILTIKLKISLKNEDDTYPLENNFLYEFRNNNIIKNFHITSFYEQSSVTYIKVYGTEQDLTEFFGTLEGKALANYNMKIYDTFKVSQFDECKPPENVNFYAVTSNSIKIKPVIDFTFINSWMIRYKENSNSDWISIKDITTSEYLLENLKENTVYELDVSLKCSTNSKNSDYSKIFLFRTL